MRGYYTVNNGEYSLEIKRSEFIAYSYSIESEEQAIKLIEDLRKKHYDARHVCFAYVVDELGNRARFSDDGEPGGTAGMPILDAIKNNELKKTLIAVVRYFGGILLGAGGLVRAYSDSAAGVIRESGRKFMRYSDLYEITADYSLYKRISRSIEALGSVESIEYGSGVTVVLSVENGCEVINKLTDASSGKAEIKFIGNDYTETQI